MCCFSPFLPPLPCPSGLPKHEVFFTSCLSLNLPNDLKSVRIFLVLGDKKKISTQGHQNKTRMRLVHKISAARSWSGHTSDSVL